MLRCARSSRLLAPVRYIVAFGSFCPEPLAGGVFAGWLLAAVLFSSSRSDRILQPLLLVEIAKKT
jgi:hypothetical protein